MKKILLLVALATTMAMAGHYIEIRQPDGTTITCYVWNDGFIDCKQ